MQQVHKICCWPIRYVRCSPPTIRVDPERRCLDLPFLVTLDLTELPQRSIHNPQLRVHLDVFRHIPLPVSWFLPLILQNSSLSKTMLWIRLLYESDSQWSREELIGFLHQLPWYQNRHNPLHLHLNLRKQFCLPSPSLLEPTGSFC